MGRFRNVKFYSFNLRVKWRRLLIILSISFLKSSMSEAARQRS